MRLQGKVAIVTGGGSGFGAGIVRKFVAEGAQVLVADIQLAAAQTVAAEVGPQALALRVDVANAADVKQMVDTAIERFGRLDILINNAGVTHLPQALEDVSEADFDRIVAVNMKAIYLAARVVVPRFKARQRGVILNMASTAGVSPRPRLSWYNASKGAVNVLSKSMAAELGAEGIRVNAVCPVMGATNLIEQFLGAADTPEARARVIAGIPLGRMSTPEDVAEATLYLASDAAAFITGIELPVDGGRTI